MPDPAPITENVTVRFPTKPTKPARNKRATPPRSDRPREYLTEVEVEQLCAAAKKRSRYGHRDAAMIWLAYRHGLRAGELVALVWSQIDLSGGKIHVNRLKNGDSSVHPLGGRELRALRRIQREQPTGSRYVFLTERKGPFTTNGFGRLLARTGEAAGLPFLVHPHMLRHACGFTLANAGHDTRAIQLYLGHRQIQHTVRYTQLAPNRFERFWRN